jgi:asparagine synthase (glutamine-hydrolysing)
MPGIVGIVTRMPRKEAEVKLQQMVNALLHESFYVTGVWVDEQLGVYVGWIVRKNSFCDGMPIQNERGDITLVFSGEEFPAPHTMQGLKERGHQLGSDGPSYLVHLYEENPSFLAGLNGRFHGLLVDKNQGTTTLFNDRYGMHRIYYHESKDGFYFAAEAKAILSVCPDVRRIDTKGLGEFVSCGCVLENRTLFEGIHVLPGASAWIFRKGSIELKGAYFHPKEWEEQPALELKPYYEKVRDIFSQNLARYFAGHERVGMSLTGGLDTRMILAWHKSPPGSLPTYTFGGMFRDSRDVIVGRQLAQACGQTHTVIPVDDEFLSCFPHYAERTVYLTDGCADVSRSPDLYVNEIAREIAPVRMSGLYGGEVLRSWSSRKSPGVRAFRPVEPPTGLFCREFLARVHEARETYSNLILGHPLSFSVFRQCPWHFYGSLALEQTQLSMRSPFLDNDLVQTVFRAPESACSNNDICLRLIADGHLDLRNILTDRGLCGNRGYFVSMISRGLLEFLFKADYAFDYGMPQWLARINYFASLFRAERIFLGRHKFYHFRVWYSDALSGYIRDMLLDQRTLSRPYFDKSRLEAMILGHLKGNYNCTTGIHKVLTIELLHRLFLDQDVRTGRA